MSYIKPILGISIVVYALAATVYIAMHYTTDKIPNSALHGGIDGLGLYCGTIQRIESSGYECKINLSGERLFIDTRYLIDFKKKQEFNIGDAIECLGSPNETDGYPERLAQIGTLFKWVAGEGPSGIVWHPSKEHPAVIAAFVRSASYVRIDQPKAGTMPSPQ